jgi:hypothetical protein
VRILRLLAALVVFVTLPNAYAEQERTCSDDVIATVARWAEISGDPAERVSAATCKVMPNAPQTTIAVVAFDIPSKKLWPDQRAWLQAITLIENGKVVAGNRSTIEEDGLTAVGGYSYRIDTARYQLSPAVRAFGVVFSSDVVWPGAAQAYAGGELTLWIRDKDRLQPVFGTNLYGAISLDRYGLRSSENVIQASMTIGIEETSHHGFADLSITAHIEGYADKRIARTIVRYDGKSYGIDMFQNFWYPPGWE